MKKIFITVLLCVLISMTPEAYSQVLQNPDNDSSGVLQNRKGDLAPPVKMNMYYNNQEVTGYVFQASGEPFVLIDSLKSLFNYNDMIDTDRGSFMVNGRAVDKYYYGNNLYLDLVDFCNAIGVSPRLTPNAIVFVSKNTAQYTPASSGNPALTLSIKGQTSGSNSDPVNNQSYIYTVGLTNTTNTPIVINHFNIAVQGRSGQRYVSIKDMSYCVVFGSNDTSDAIMLDPGQEHVLNLTFDLPESDTPSTLYVQKNQAVLGSVSL